MAADVKQLLAPVLAEMKARIDAAPDEDAKKEARAAYLDEVKDAAPDVFNAIHTTAFNAGKGEAKKAKEKYDAKLKAVETERDELKEQLDAAKAEKPDIPAIEAKANARAAKLEKELESTRAAHAKEHRDRLMKDARADVEAALIEQGYRPRAAKSEVLRLMDEGKIKLSEDGTAIEFVKLDDSEALYGAPRAGAKPHDALVKDLRAKADPLDILSTADRGAGQRQGAGGAPPPGRQPGVTGDGATVTLRDINGEENKINLSPEFLADKRRQLQGSSV
jgi:hypothetical protein